MRLRYNFRLYPKPGQRQALARAFGCARVVFNDTVTARRQAYAAGVKLKDSELQTQVITRAKKTLARVWLSEVSSVVLVQAVGDAHTAYSNFFASLSGKRNGAKLGAPRYRSRKDSRQTARFTRNGFSLRGNGKLFLAKIGDVQVRWSRELPSEPSSVTVIKDSAGRYFASFVVEIGEPAPLPEVGSEIGLDLGLTSYAIDSRGRVITNPRFLRNHERRLKRAQKALSRKEKGSKNRVKARVRVARAHARVADCRRDWLHQITTQLIRDNQAVYLEDLAVKGLARTRLAKSVYDASWGMFRRMLVEKGQRYGRHIGVIGRFEPTSQVCSNCQHRDGPKPLSARTWTCQPCGTVHDRDHNAAKNILALGRRERLNACGETSKTWPCAAVGSLSEAGTHPGADGIRAQARATGAAGIPVFRAGRTSISSDTVRIARHFVL